MTAKHTVPTALEAKLPLVAEERVGAEGQLASSEAGSDPGVALVDPRVGAARV
jgi:hypothetical protein